jgi:cyclopropane fatty-acyl-phospholipid synthase-like methyltransferase
VAIRVYEPVEIGGRRVRHNRETDNRWTAIAKVLKDHGATSVLDVGCAEGWLIRRAATDLRCFAVGVEASDRVLTGELSRLHDNVERAAIIKARLTPEDIRALPKFDAVLCLSVVHHIIRKDGIGVAEDFINALSSRAGKVVVFEMGTSDEGGLSWSGQLPEMPEGQTAFVMALLERGGLVNIRRIGSSDAFHGSAARLLFTGEPNPSVLRS